MNSWICQGERCTIFFWAPKAAQTPSERAREPARAPVKCCEWSMVDAQSQVFVSKSVSSRIYILLFIDLCIFNDLKSFKIEFNLYSFFHWFNVQSPSGVAMLQFVLDIAPG